MGRSSDCAAKISSEQRFDEVSVEHATKEFARPVRTDDNRSGLIWHTEAVVNVSPGVINVGEGKSAFVNEVEIGHFVSRPRNANDVDGLFPQL